MHRSKLKIPLGLNAQFLHWSKIRTLRLALSIATVLAVLGGVVLAYNSAARNSLRGLP